MIDDSSPLQVKKQGGADGALSDDGRALPMPFAPARVSLVAHLAEIPEEDIWLAKQRARAPAGRIGSTFGTSCSRWRSPRPRNCARPITRR